MSDEDLEQIRELLGRLAQRYPSAEDEEFLHRAPVLAHQLPEAVRWEIHEFKVRENRAVLVVSGFPVDSRKIGRTPAHWNLKSKESSATVEEDLFLVLTCSLLGHPVGWSTQQDGFVVHDILPIEGHQSEQLGSGSEQLLWWHTEDAFHPYRGDYICMFCLRNPDRVPTTICAVEQLELQDSVRRVLFEKRFTIRPDESHLPKNRGNGSLAREVEGAYSRIAAMNTEPEKIAVLFGDPGAPYLRIDPYFMDELKSDPQAQAALDELSAQIDRKISEVSLEPGDLCIVDNFRAVHGRLPFKARFDGTDRWLKRLNVTRDLRKSRAARPRPDCLVIR